jgi:uncharacterized protein (TIGR02611 family)
MARCRRWRKAPPENRRSPQSAGGSDLHRAKQSIGICKGTAVCLPATRRVAGTARARSKAGRRMRTAKTVTGFVLLGAGIAMLALPGPGWLTIFAGLAMLAGQFQWARRLLNRVKDAANRVRPAHTRSRHVAETRQSNRSRGGRPPVGARSAANASRRRAVVGRRAKTATPEAAASSGKYESDAMSRKGLS